MSTKLLARVALLGLAAMAALTSVAAPATAVPNLTRTSATSVADSTQTKEALAQCPAGTRVLGGGGTINGGGGNVHFIRLQALGSTDRFAAAAMEDGNYPGSWSVTAWAICGQQPAGLTYVSFVSPDNPDEHKDAAVECPDGTVAISHGVRVVGSTGHVVIGGFGPLAPTGTKANATEDQHGEPADWDLWAHAVCASSLPGQQLVWADDIPADSNPDIVTVNCPTGKRVHGLGSTINQSFGEVFHVALVPNAALTAVTATAIEDSSGAAFNWWTRVYAICAF
ncbi:hypothetical protein Rhe02_24330 [Rhizocola hellebori]|uniref:Uncharacterized protein n=1 Tax=Rhizocola hellebori TaxID=1392758 RepID=A0A8J3Q5W0_9ACTN|nr:hypothetical protein [Rhizocola hellebori]GIH04366.1 hypothetical protein Rhe02_24330 [Rhizocola hellebori]